MFNTADVAMVNILLLWFDKNHNFENVVESLWFEPKMIISKNNGEETQEGDHFYLEKLHHFKSQITIKDWIIGLWNVLGR